MRHLVIYTMILAGIFLGSCTPDRAGQYDEETTRAVLDHHWKAFKENDLEAVMEDYTEESLLITPDTTYMGLEAIRANFIRAFEAFPREENPLLLTKTVVEKDVGYIIWEATTDNFDLIFATDTFIIRDGKIIRQTYGGITNRDLE